MANNKKNKNKIVLMAGEKEFHYIALVIMILMMVFCIIPLILMATVSLSSEESLVRGYRFIPDKWSLDAYMFMWAKRATIFRAYGLTILVTVIGTIISLVMTSMFAYPFPGKTSNRETSLPSSCSSRCCSTAA